MKNDFHSKNPDTPGKNVDFIEYCRRHGVRATNQRVEVFKALAETKEHPDVETVYRQVRKRIPMISLDTVYRTLRMLEAKGMAARVGGIMEKARFDADTKPHYHFVCTKCGFVGDLYPDEPLVPKFQTDPAKMGSVESIYCEVRGLCNKCRRKSSKEK